jgi:aspartate/methionine/tyrosine aminotransferase
MTSRINPHLIDTGTPPIPEALAWLAQYDDSEQAAIKLSQAAPGQLPPLSLRMSLAQAAASDEAQRYGDIFGDMPFRERFAEVTNRLYGGNLRASEIAITPGCNQAFVSVLMAIAQAGDNIILPVPHYFNHAMAAQMLGIEARALPCDAALGFVPEADAASDLIDARTRAIVLVTPNNPTGAIYPRETIAAFAALARARGLWLLVDETYRDFLPDDAQAPHGLFGDRAARDSVIGLYSFSKAYAIPGHRLGAVIAPAPLMKELGKVLDTLQICPARTAQLALTEEMDGLSGWIAGNRRMINQRARTFRTVMGAVPQFRIERIGAYFAYVRHGFSGRRAEDVARHLAVQHGVLALPGSWFGPGQEQHLRFAFANADAETLAEAAQRMSQMKFG